MHCRDFCGKDLSVREAAQMFVARRHVMHGSGRMALVTYRNARAIVDIASCKDLDLFTDYEKRG